MSAIGEPFKQAARLPSDGAAGVQRVSDSHLAINVTNDGKPESLMLSEFNASRVLAMLALMLGVKIDKAHAKGIKL